MDKGEVGECKPSPCSQRLRVADQVPIRRCLRHGSRKALFERTVERHWFVRGEDGVAARESESCRALRQQAGRFELKSGAPAKQGNNPAESSAVDACVVEQRQRTGELDACLVACGGHDHNEATAFCSPHDRERVPFDINCHSIRLGQQALRQRKVGACGEIDGRDGPSEGGQRLEVGQIAKHAGFDRI